MMRKKSVNHSVDAAATECSLNLAAGRSLLAAGEKSTLCLKIGVTGFETESEMKRPRLNVALVIDRSGSMAGSNIEQAKHAASHAVNLLREDDIVSVVIYDDEVEVLVPATKVSNKRDILSKIDSIGIGGCTALYAGTEKGGREVKKFFEKGYVNRVVLLSDGLANVGPSTPEELEKLGRKLGGKGICVTTLGLGEGYDEDLMQRLARASDGNHFFVTSERKLVEVFDEEFKTATKVVASEVACEVTCAEGVRPIRVLNRDAKIRGQKVSFSWNQIYSGHERYVLLEVEVPAGKDGEKLSVAEAKLTYANMVTRRAETVTKTIEVAYSASERAVKASENEDVMKDYAEQKVAEAREEAIQLRDRGDIVGAQARLESSQMFACYSPVLAKEIADEAEAVENEGVWNTARKMMRARANKSRTQQKGDSVR